LIFEPLVRYYVCIKTLERKCLLIHCQFDDTEERHLHTKSKLNKQLDDAKHELNSTVNKLGTVEEERLEGIARVEACQKRIDIIEKLMEAEERQTNETRCKRIEAFHEFEKAFIAKQQSWNGLLSQ
jgi:chromosome segregation ATPase